MKKTNVNIRLSINIKEMAQKKAEQMGMSLSEYVRYLIMRDLETK